MLLFPLTAFVIVSFRNKTTAVSPAEGGETKAFTKAKANLCRAKV